LEPPSSTFHRKPLPMPVEHCGACNYHNDL
jgi:hypothetical protein